MSASQFHWKRRTVQIATILLFALIPAIGLFRIDLTTASFHFLEHQIWWSNFSLTFGLAIVLATLPILTYMTIGTVWCGWACPQNTLSEWANNLTHQFLGKRANVDVDSKGMLIASAKNKAINWILLAIIFLGASLILGFIPFLYFYSIVEIWAFVTHSSFNKLSVFMQQLYFVAVFLIFIDIAVVRFFLCNYFCLYRIGQRIFKTKDALHISYDSSRSADCNKCNFCSTSCVTSIKPIDIKPYDTCINCGECIDACNRLHNKTGTNGLLNFELGRIGRNSNLLQKFKEVFSRFNWVVGGIFFIGCAMMIWGIATAPEVRPALSPAELQKAHQTAEICKNQCMAQQMSCKSGTLSSCYQTAACQCQCYLQQDPSSSSSKEWMQCISKNTEKANELINVKNGELNSPRK